MFCRFQTTRYLGYHAVLAKPIGRVAAHSLLGRRPPALLAFAAGHTIPCPSFTVAKACLSIPISIEEMVDQFWFKAMLAGYKVVRDDRLIALHLALDLVRDCCVAGMMLRDRSERTNIHREGGLGNHVVANLESTRSSYTAGGILDIIEQSAIQFDQLASE
jgi:hypothetical protein